MAVYFIRAGESGPVKIGKARDVTNRMRLFQTAHHAKLMLLRTIPGDRREERWLHRRYSELRLHGEWFQFCDEMMSVDVPPQVEAESVAGTVRPKRERPHSKLMEAVGTLREISLGLDRPYPTVAAWYQRGAIPHWEWKDFIAFAASKGVNVTLEQIYSARHPDQKGFA